MLKIRHVLEDDKPFWTAIDGHISINELELKIRDKRGYVICDDDKPIGLMRYNLFWDTVPFLTLINLDESYRGKGFGSQAMEYWENEMRVLGHELVMTSTQSDEQVQHFYRKMGYKDSGCLLINRNEPSEIFFTKFLDE